MTAASNRRKSYRNGQQTRNVYSDPNRKPRHENGGRFDGVNHDTDLGDFMEAAYRLELAQRRKVEE